MASDDSDIDSASDSGAETTKIKTTVLSKIPTITKAEPKVSAPKLSNEPLTFRSFLYSRTFQHFVLVSLPILSLLGVYGTWTLGYSDGLFASIVTLLEDPLANLPGTDEQLLRRYTSLGWVDAQLQILVCFFAPVLDMGWGREGLALFSVYGLGQFGGVWTLMFMEGLRVGNKGLIVSFVGTVGCIFQNISYTITTPLWILLHLLTSPIAKPFPGTHGNSVLLIQPWDLLVLPFSITISYLLPSLLMGLPSPGIFSSITHQRWIAIWQAFPLWTVLTHYLLRRTIEFIYSRIHKIESKDRTPIPQGTSYLNNAKFVYQFVLGLCIFTHIPVLLIAILPSWLFPSFSPTLTRLGKETISSIYIPPFPSMSHVLSSFSEGVHIFLQWDLYIGSTAFLLWGIVLLRNARTERAIADPEKSLPVYRELLVGEKGKGDAGGEKTTRKLVLKLVSWCLAAGPIGAVTVLLWERDAIVRQKIKQGI